MKLIKNKFLIKLIASICLFLTLLNFASGSKVYANEQIWGGVLINPMINLMTGIGDTVMEILHKSIQTNSERTQETAIIKVNGSETWWETLASILAVVAAILAAVVCIVVVVAATGGVAAGAAALAGGAAKAAFVAAAGKAAGGAILAGVGVGIIAGVAAKEAMIPNDIYLPAFSITAEEIFRNEISLFDVNFFHPMPDKVTKVSNWYVVDQKTEETINFNWETMSEFLYPWKPDDDDYRKGEKLKTLSGAYSVLQGYLGIDSRATWIEWDGNDWETSDDLYTYGMFKYKKLSQKVDYSKALGNAYDCWMSDAELVTDAQNLMKDLGFSTEIISNDYTYRYYPPSKNGEVVYANTTDAQYYYSPYLVTRIAIYDSDNELVAEYKEELVSRCNVTEDKYEYIKNIKITKPTFADKPTITTDKSTASQLRGIVSKWYNILRNIALLVLMLVLIYTGIKIVIGSTAGEKAKYKERLMDWLIAVCLLFVMHYIMIFTVELVEKIVDLVGEGIANGNSAYIELTEVQEKNVKGVLESFDTIGQAKNENGEVGKGAVAYYDENGNRLAAEHGALIWPTDLAGLFRIQSQFTEEGTSLWVGYSFCYFILVLFTLFFAWTYLRRVLYMAFLTMIAPLVAMTYPIDKMTDGKAQAFDAWLKEYIFNLLIQPLHLLLYAFLVGSAYELASKSPIYALVAIGFMMPAEKLLRRFFGFEKAKTPGLLGGAAGAALAMTGLQKLMGGHGKGKSGSGGSNEKDNSKDIKFSSNDGVSTYDALLGGTPVAGGGTGGAAPTPGATRGTPVAGGGTGGAVPTPAAGGTPVAGGGTGGAAPTPAAGGTPPAPTTGGATTGRWKRLGRTIAGVSSAYARGLGKKALKRIQNGRPIRALARGITGALGGTLLGATGLALGIASGDPSKAFQYTTAGLAGGYSAGKGVAGSISDTFSVNSKEMEEEAKMSWYGDEYKDQIFEQQEKDDLMSEGNINYLRTVLGLSRGEAEDFLDTTGRECYKSGVRDVEDMAAIHEVSGDISLPEAIAATKLKNNLPQKIKNMSEKKLSEYRHTYAAAFRERLKRMYPDWTDARLDTEAGNYADNTIRYMKNLDKARSSVTQV